MTRSRSHFDLPGPERTRSAFEALDRFGQLREEVMRSVDPPLSRGVLYGLGFREGLAYGRRLAAGFELGQRLDGDVPGIPLLFRAEACTSEGLSGVLDRSPEAEVQLAGEGRTHAPACWLSAGFASGYYTEAFDRVVLVRELDCRAAGARRCRFVCRDAARWERDRDAVMAEMLAFLDVPALRCSVAEAPPPIEGDLLGGFDPMSPAAHVWGPVVVLPYSGVDDSDQALAAICSDVDVEQLRVAVIDLTGVQMDAIEATGLAVFLDRVAALELLPIVVGLAPELARRFSSCEGGLAAPLFAGSLSEGIALGFQLSQPSAISQ